MQGFQTFNDLNSQILSKIPQLNPQAAAGSIFNSIPTINTTNLFSAPASSNSLFQAPQQNQDTKNLQFFQQKQMTAQTLQSQLDMQQKLEQQLAQMQKLESQSKINQKIEEEDDQDNEQTQEQQQKSLLSLPQSNNYDYKSIQQKNSCNDMKSYQQQQRSLQDISPLGNELQQFIGNELGRKIPQQDFSQQSSSTLQQQQQQNQKQGMVCELHKGKLLDKVCLSTFCMKQKICCEMCVVQNHNQHDIVDIEQYMVNLKEIENKIEINTQKEKQSWEKIQLVVDNNCKYLQTLEQLAKKLSEHCQKLQQTLNIIQEKQTIQQLNLKKQIQTVHQRYQHFIPQEQKQQIHDLNMLVNSLSKFEQPIIMECPQIIDAIDFNCQFNNYNEQVLKDFAFYINKSDEIQVSLEKYFGYQEFQLISQLKKEKNEKILNNKMSKVFHLIKGKAKKRDIINFVHWDEERKELKFMKDIKEKIENSHYQLVFSVYLKNLELIEEEKIDEELMKWLNQIIVDKYPQVKKQKEEQRRSINTKDGTNKRKYCKLNPRFEVDVKQYLAAGLTSFPSFNE